MLNTSLLRRAGMNNATGRNGLATHSFPPDGLVAVSRIAYESTPLLTAQIRSGVFVLAGAGGNVTAIAGSQGHAIVDTGYGPRVGEIADGIVGALGRAPRWVIDTHWHFDHTDGNAEFARAGATVLGHTECRTRLSTSQYVPSLSWRISASPPEACPSLTFDQPFALNIGTEELHLLPQAPAHTDGDVAVFLGSANVLVMGDLFTHHSYPVIDESSRGSLRGMIEAVDRLLPMIDKDTVVVPGHGAATDRTGLLAFRDMLRSIEDRILVLIEAQREASEIIESKPTGEFDSLWGRGYVSGAHFTHMALAGMGLTNTPAALPTPAA
jgi:glyoxylase-like metal-dependent hydrolase (beta-lactamase superfamily II)